ncbi:MAG: LLM class flavin-dependent oxidoreductase, partial [Chloroflexi bacterium]
MHKAAAAVRRGRHQAHRVSADPRRRATARPRVAAEAPGGQGPASPARQGRRMRLGLILTERREADMARLAESHGLFGVLAGTGEPRTAITAAVYASTATDFVRVVVNVRLGREHPVTIAEELSVLDNVNNGRTMVLADTA